MMMIKFHEKFCLLSAINWGWVGDDVVDAVVSVCLDIYPPVCLSTRLPPCHCAEMMMATIIITINDIILVVI